MEDMKLLAVTLTCKRSCNFIMRL